MSILAVPKQSLLQLLARHDDIFEVRMLQKALRLRLNIDENNYNAYFVGLESYDPIGKCVLWNRINLMRESVCNIVRKSQREVSSTWLGQILGIKTK